ncbi:hypothetical protein [Limnobacter litoralis]|uniref:Uncharacterized protein n=1 Tax=Limnobacter litoralis TaxID=481366 RepID=A0ABQ5YPF1_9BURK|nr:hypothetical protein [Limnobacter litoralis]GLR25312.1 hypothetical protein GCM10007875_04000 [Limnobacter litoralis]
MTIRSPYQTLHCNAYPEHCYEREIFFETLGACWALSARNVSGMFPIQLRLDLCKINLLYGVPSADLPQELLNKLTVLFQSRPAGQPAHGRSVVETNAMAMMREMNRADFLSFSMGFQDAVEQVLVHAECWNPRCQRAYMAIKFSAMSLIEQGFNSEKHRGTYADLLSEYLNITQSVFSSESKTYPLNH